jgi:imidazolonepropionase-like amidohydrolase
MDCLLSTPMIFLTIKIIMMRKIFLAITIFYSVAIHAQSNVLPAPAQKGVMYIKGATIHVGNGKVIENGVIKIKDGKIEEVGAGLTVPEGGQVVDAKGKHVYPGLILPVSNLGLVEIGSVRASNDVQEIGEFNPNVRSIVAYNTDSKVINTLRSNGVLLANIVPQGSLLAGSSSVVQLDAWNWEDAAYKTDAGMHLYMPAMMPRARFGGFGGGGGPQAPASDPVKEGL